MTGYMSFDFFSPSVMTSNFCGISMDRIMPIITMPSMRSNHSLLILSDTSAPSRAPGRVRRDSLMLFSSSEILALRYERVADTLWSSMPIRLVPFATVLSSPMKISAGRVRLEPPPAITLITPAKSPTPKRIRISRYTGIISAQPNLLSRGGSGTDGINDR